MGALGWLSRRALAAWIFAPLFGFWYAVFTYGYKLPPGILGIPSRPDQEVLFAALIMAFITDFLIVRSVKRAMKRREQAAQRT